MKILTKKTIYQNVLLAVVYEIIWNIGYEKYSLNIKNSKMYKANYEDMALNYPYKNTKKDFFFLSS